MRFISLSKRKIALLLVVLPVLLVGCSSQPQPELEMNRVSFYRIRFDSSMNLRRAPLAVFDSTKALLRDVVEIGGRALDIGPDTVAIAPLYVLLEDRQHPGETRTIRGSGPAALPDFLLVPVQPGVHIEPWNPRHKGFTSRIFPIVFLIGVLLYFRNAEW
jgi:hypothetical protein